MAEVKIVTNHHRRPLLSYWELSDKEQAQAESNYGGLLELEEETYFTYRGYVYTLSDFMRFNYGGSPTPAWAKGYYAYMSDSFFSGVMIQHVNDDTSDWEDCVVVATFYS